MRAGGRAEHLAEQLRLRVVEVVVATGQEPQELREVRDGVSAALRGPDQ
jgi:hypothetical protein